MAFVKNAVKPMGSPNCDMTPHGMTTSPCLPGLPPLASAIYISRAMYVRNALAGVAACFNLLLWTNDTRHVDNQPVPTFRFYKHLGYLGIGRGLEAWPIPLGTYMPVPGRQGS